MTARQRFKVWYEACCTARGIYSCYPLLKEPSRYGGFVLSVKIKWREDGVDNAEIIFARPVTKNYTKRVLNYIYNTIYMYDELIIKIIYSYLLLTKLKR